jgi:hypothetical protein
MTDNDYNNIDKRFDGLTTLLNARFKDSENQIYGITQRLDRLNGSVQRHETQIQEALVEQAKNREQQKNAYVNHVLHCPVAPRVQKLEADKGVRLGIKQFVVGVISIMAVLVGMSVSIIKFSENMRQKQNQNIEAIIKAEIQQELQK